MIRYEDPNQQLLPGFEKFHGFPLDMHNHWIKLSRLIPWDEFAKVYNKNMSFGMGRPAKPARLVIGAIIIKHKLCLSDQEIIDQIRENPYLQYFVGLKTFQTEAPFAPSLFIDIRRRMGDDLFEQFNQSIVNRLESKNNKNVETEETEEDIDKETTPHIRPIVWGKAGKKVEFSAKLGVSLTADGLARIDHLSWEFW